MSDLACLNRMRTLTTVELSSDRLVVECSGLTLSSPSDRDVDSLMDVYSYDFDFSGATDGDDLQSIRDRQLRSVRRHRQLAKTSDWRLHLVAKTESDSIAGWATLGIVNDPKRAVLESTSWVVKTLRSRGNGTLIRHGVLALAFVGLEADVVLSSPLSTSERSIAVSEKLGFERVSFSRSSDRCSPRVYMNFELTRRTWERTRQLAHVRGHETIRDWLTAEVYP